MSKYAYCEDYSLMYRILEEVSDDTGIDVSSLSFDSQSLIIIFVAVNLANHILDTFYECLEEFKNVQKK